MLKKILSISGKPGLYRMVSYSKRMLVVENIETKKRLPAYAADRVVSLGDIAVYTSGEDIPLSKVLETMREKYNGESIDDTNLKTPDQLTEFFGEILPDFDRERVYKSDIKKMVAWYNLLIKSGFTSFLPVEEPEQEGEAEAKADE